MLTWHNGFTQACPHQPLPRTHNQGRARFQYYQKLGAFAFAIAQSLGQLTYIRPYVEDFTPGWLFGSTCALTAGAMALVYIADTISELKVCLRSAMCVHTL